MSISRSLAPASRFQFLFQLRCLPGRHARLAPFDMPWQEMRDWQGLATSLTNLGWTAHHQGDYATAEALHQETLGLVGPSLSQNGWRVSRKTVDESLDGVSDPVITSCALP